jgi:RNA polymerase sigma-54 factor
MNHRESMADIDLDAYFNDYWEASPPYTPRPEERELPPLENTLTREPDLYDHLHWQLHMSDVPARRREIAELIIGNLDPDGFLVATVEEMAAMGGADNGDAYAVEEVQEALDLVRGFDPPGVGCSDLRESLLRQLAQREEGPIRELARRIVADHWELFLRRQFPGIAKELGLPLAELEPAVELIKSLETRPGRAHSSERTHYVEPDVAVIKVGEDYVIQLNDDGLPRLRVSRSYRRMLHEMRAEGRQAEAQQFIKDKMRSALWLIKSLDQRQRTIYKVADSIVRQQREFLDHGIERLKPMVLRDVAEDIGMHESTVSRVVSNKYMHTPRGLFPMKFFFHSGIDREYGDDISSLTVKKRIQQLIAAEDPKRPLSDSELMRILNREGIHIARRTVAKYRDELKIPSSTDRKQIF